MNITKQYLKQVIKEELTRVLFEKAMTEQAVEQLVGDEPGPQSQGCGPGEVQTGTNDDGTPMCGPEVEKVKKRKKSKLSNENHKYRRFVNGLKKKGKIDKKGWRTLRRALHKMDMTNPQQNQKFNQLLKQTVVAHQKAARGGMPVDYNKWLPKIKAIVKDGNLQSAKAGVRRSGNKEALAAIEYYERVNPL